MMMMIMMVVVVVVVVGGAVPSCPPKLVKTISLYPMSVFFFFFTSGVSVREGRDATPARVGKTLSGSGRGREREVFFRAF
ncbi:hypothetical protein B0F90DRAFT_1735304, partial [Multifurca ochricompacta]